MNLKNVLSLAIYVAFLNLVSANQDTRPADTRPGEGGSSSPLPTRTRDDAPTDDGGPTPTTTAPVEDDVIYETGAPQEEPEPTEIDSGEIDNNEDFNETENKGGVDTTAIIGASAAGVGVAGAASAVFFMKKTGVAGSLLNAFSGNGQAGNMARENPLYNAATTEHNNPLYNPGDAV